VLCIGAGDHGGDKKNQSNGQFGPSILGAMRGSCSQIDARRLTRRMKVQNRATRLTRAAVADRRDPAAVGHSGGAGCTRECRGDAGR
jgi:hypothetical protein